jgi:hypothetical protein
MSKHRLDIVLFLDTPAIKERYQLKKMISLATAKWWMHMMDYHWMKQPSGQYVDGHECEDVSANASCTQVESLGLERWNGLGGAHIHRANPMHRLHCDLVA